MHYNHLNHAHTVSAYTKQGGTDTHHGPRDHHCPILWPLGFFGVSSRRERDPTSDLRKRVEVARREDLAHHTRHLRGNGRVVLAVRGCNVPVFVVRRARRVKRLDRVACGREMMGRGRLALWKARSEGS